MPFQSRVRTIVGWRLAQLVKDYIEIPPPALPEPGVGVNALEPSDARIIVQRLPEDIDPPAPRVGRYSSLNWRAQLLVGGGHRADWVSTFNMRYQMGTGPLPQGMPTSKGPIVIGNDVWIGYEALVLSGVTIGDGAVVGARAVVTKDVEPYSVVVGSPAKHHHYRFDEPTREALLRIAWWDWPQDKVRAHVDQLNDADVARFVGCHDPATDRKRCTAC